MGARIAIESNGGHQSAKNSTACSTQCETRLLSTCCSHRTSRGALLGTGNASRMSCAHCRSSVARYGVLLLPITALAAMVQSFV
jgi:hypothetical protein